MGGPASPESWRGNLEGINYNIGGSWIEGHEGWTAQISTHNWEDKVRTANVFGYIRGAAEPDRYVLFGNHRDAWGFGAIDPSSGTAQVMETARVLGNAVLNKGWRPQRSIVVASFAAEEAGLMGSWESVHEKINQLSQRAVGYINTDICTSGPIPKTQSSPSLRDVTIEAFKGTPDPNQPDRSYWDFWSEWTNQDNEGEPKANKIPLSGSGSDHAPFTFYAGIPSINHRFKDDTKKFKGVGQYPIYHTGYETFYLVDKIVDPGFKITKVCSQTTLRMLVNMADSKFIPYNLNNVPKAMEDAMENFDNKNVTYQLESNGASLKYLREAIGELRGAAELMMDKIKSSFNLDPIQVRILNDQLLGFERTFLIPGGLPERPDMRHAIFAPAKFNLYGSSAFPGISDLLHDIEKLKGKEAEDQWEKVKRHISDLMIIVKQSAAFLKNPSIM